MKAQIDEMQQRIVATEQEHAKQVALLNVRGLQYVFSIISRMNTKFGLKTRRFTLIMHRNS